MNNKILFIATAVIFSTTLQAQYKPPTYSDDPPASNMPPNRIFIGGALGIGFASNSFQIGATPEIGYSVAQWLDAGISFNISYYAESANPDYNYNTSYHNLIYGGGPFLRIYPIRFIFLQAQLEQNWNHVKAQDEYNNYTSEATYQATSFIGGIGYSQRIVGQSNFYTLIGFDFLNEPYSPYRDYYGNGIPIIRAGFNFYLRPGKKK